MKTLLEAERSNVIAWMGGSRPPKPSQVNRNFCGLQKLLFGEQVEAFRGYWGDAPNWDTLRIYYRRARYDTHATTRN